MGLFAGIKDAEESRFGKFILPGDYILKLERCKQQVSQKTKGLLLFIAEFSIIESTNDKRPAGSRMTWIVKMTMVEYPETAMGNVKSFMNVGLESMQRAAGAGDDEIQTLDTLSKEEAEETAEAIAPDPDSNSDSNLLVGTYFYAEALNKPTRKGTDFTVVNWSVPPNLQELVSVAA